MFGTIYSIYQLCLFLSGGISFFSFILRVQSPPFPNFFYLLFVIAEKLMTLSTCFISQLFFFLSSRTTPFILIALMNIISSTSYAYFSIFSAFLEFLNSTTLKLYIYLSPSSYFCCTLYRSVFPTHGFPKYFQSRIDR